jgi:outer membrane protein assembly factor BamC
MFNGTSGETYPGSRCQHCGVDVRIAFPMRLIGLVVIAASLAMLAAGCSGTSERRKIDYKSAGRLPPLEIPPDLATPVNSERYVVPAQDGATYSDYSRERNAVRSGEQGTSIVPQREGMQVERDGSFRWLIVDLEPDALWQPLREFWQETGFLIAMEVPEAGIMETDWAENRANVPLNAFQRAIKRVFDSAYSSSERDKFRTRVERGETSGRSEIFISHHGMVQVSNNNVQNPGTMWEVRPPDPELEAEMLYLLMAKLGGTQAQVEQARAAPPPPPRAELTSSKDLVYLELRDPIDRAWRRVGLALDRIGFTVEDQDRSEGVYLVRYNDPDAAAKGKGLGRLAFWRDDDAVDQQFRISLIEQGDGSEVRVLDTEGETVVSPTASRILALLQNELK